MIGDAYNQLIIKLNESFMFPGTGEKIIGVKYSEAPFNDYKLLASLYGNEGFQELYTDGDFIWVKNWDSDTLVRLRYKWPFLIKFELLD